ncbi:hypothetical protein N3C_1334 [Clostridium sp. N3C]|uniref:hypothetical protein n=1 Tax=Clostridium sp. N3C TaxID=1776758 RepID=UPI00092E1234|nr:hypothetical protein [Clostridium sp. N3C]SCN23503.1 hypothetical protein N3C_1334 [Clostridium sp. N3C]
MDNLAAKLKIDQPDPNMTNITKYNFMDIFSDKTIKDPRDVMKSISMDEIENPVEFISRNLSQTNYCIRAKDMNDICNKYVQQVSELKSNIESIKKEKWKLRYKKWLYIGLTLILLIVISKYELLSYDVSMLLFGLSFILLVLYFFIG